jgi:hypothetical protein
MSAAAKPARTGTITVMKRLYSQVAMQTIDLLVIRSPFGTNLD